MRVSAPAGTVRTARSAPRRSDGCAEEGTAWSARTTGPATATRPTAADGLVRARTSFLVDDEVEAGAVRDTILASWTRSREWDVDTDDVELSCEFDPEPDSPLTRAAEPVLADVADQLAGEPVSVILTDADGVVLERRTGDSALHQHLDQVWLAPGFSYAEKFVGTNGIGTALEGRGPAQVFGHEHYVEPPGRPGLRRRPDLAPGHRQAARRRRPDLLAPGRRTVHGHRGGPDRPPDRGRAAGPVRPAGAGPAARLPDRLPAQPGRGASGSAPTW